MNTPHTHHIPTSPSGKEVAMRWLAQQLRWERLLDDLRNPTQALDEDQAA
jgi:hypothetical protein